MKLDIAVIALASFASAALVAAADNIPSAAAKDHVNETGTVCGKVVATRYMDQAENKITFLNFDQPYPDGTFIAVILGDNRAKFGEPEKIYLNKNLCVTGKIEEYNKKPQIVLTDQNQVKVESK